MPATLLEREFNAGDSNIYFGGIEIWRYQNIFSTQILLYKI